MARSRLPLTEPESGVPRSSRAPAEVSQMPMRTPYSRRPCTLEIAEATPCFEETVIGHFLGESPHGSQPLIDRGRDQFLVDEHRLVAIDQCLRQRRRLLPLRPCQKFIQCRSVSAARMGAGEAIESQADQSFLEVGMYIDRF